MAPYVDFLENLKLPEEQKEAVAWKTAARLFKIDMNASARAAEEAAANRGGG